MSRQLISRSPDLQQLFDDGFQIEVPSGHLLIRHIPFLDAEGKVKYGSLISVLQLAGDVTDKPTDHVARFIGGVPHGTDGQKLSRIIIDETPQTPVPGLTTSCTFSSKPSEGYRDYHHKMTTYIAMVSAPALEVEPTATTRPLHVTIPEDTDDSVFNYIENASSRAGISVATEKLRMDSVAIVGLGGTGSYILDFLAKTPIQEIHLFDGDHFAQFNAFRSPGAPSVDELREKLTKVEWFERIYSRMRKNIHIHDCYIDETNVEVLRAMDFVFIAADSGRVKLLLARTLTEWGVPFIDVGMGLYDYEGSLGGQLRTTTSTLENNEHVSANHRISLADIGNTEKDADNVYNQNIQIAELNALNAALAVIKWKKLCGFYIDDEFEHNCVYVLSGNVLINEDKAA